MLKISSFFIMFSRKRIFHFCSYLIIFICLILYVILYSISSKSITINAEEFKKEGNYSKETILLFADVAFPYNKIRKWKEDIKVEIVKTDRLNETLIFEIDSIINILSPLIYPVKIYRVPENGNLKVHRKVDSIPISTKNAQGFCYIPPIIKKLSWNIEYAEVYDIWYSPVIFHEIIHAIGLQHPSIEYPFYMKIAGSYNFYSFEEAEKLYNPLYISEEEKIIIKMLYSPYIKSGLRKEKFIKKMKLYDYDI